jgi:hypothetical protein
MACRLSVEEFGDGQIAVELIPRVEIDTEGWPVDVLSLPDELQARILNEVNAGR